jgi:hypothetical protein
MFYRKTFVIVSCCACTFVYNVSCCACALFTMSAVARALCGQLLFTKSDLLMPAVARDILLTMSSVARPLLFAWSAVARALLFA